MLYKFAIGFVSDFLLTNNVSSNLPELGPNLLSSLNTVFPAGLQGAGRAGTANRNFGGSIPKRNRRRAGRRER